MYGTWMKSCSMYLEVQGNHNAHLTAHTSQIFHGPWVPSYFSYWLYKNQLWVGFLPSLNLQVGYPWVPCFSKMGYTILVQHFAPYTASWLEVDCKVQPVSLYIALIWVRPARIGLFGVGLCVVLVSETRQVYNPGMQNKLNLKPP